MIKFITDCTFPFWIKTVNCYPCSKRIERGKHRLNGWSQI